MGYLSIEILGPIDQSPDHLLAVGASVRWRLVKRITIADSLDEDQLTICITI
jgi:trans-2-enoyl-CoA reductase